MYLCTAPVSTFTGFDGVCITLSAVSIGKNPLAVIMSALDFDNHVTMP